VLNSLFPYLDWTSSCFRPSFSRLGVFEALLKGVARPDLVWVPCFRQRDLRAARLWSKSKGIPLVFDPLISTYDKQVFERKKYPPGGFRAHRLLRWEKSLFQAADVVIADTREHARFFEETFAIPLERIVVVPVGAEEELFSPAPPGEKGMDRKAVEILFFGSFIQLQGPHIIVEAARRYQGPPVRWRFIGHGPLLALCQKLAGSMKNIVFEPWVPYGDLPGRIRGADILLGIFGETPKAGRVIPNKVYQALACGKPVITCLSEAYPPELVGNPESGIAWVPPGDPEALVAMVADLVGLRQSLGERGHCARCSYDKHFSRQRILTQLQVLAAKVR
jgi:glycosyltransferase involved in cell wall biosynthesis